MNYNEFENLFYHNRQLINLTLELTNTCNLRCKHCYQVNRNHKFEPYYLDLSVIERMLFDISNSSVINISLTGGEVFTHPNIIEIISRIKSKNINVNLLSNCTLINENNIDVVKNNVNIISTTCYGTSRNTYEAITKVPGSYLKYKKAVSLIKQYNIRLIEKSIVMNGNYSDMEQLCRDTAYTENRIIIGKNDNYALNCKLTNSEQEKFYEYYYFNKPKEIQMYKLRKGPQKCKLWYNSAFIDCHGNVFPCLNLEDQRFAFGNICKDNIMDIWNSKENIEKINYMSETINNSPCYSCEYGRYCQICPANNYYETGNIITPSVHECELCKTKSKAIKRIFEKEG